MKKYLTYLVLLLSTFCFSQSTTHYIESVEQAKFKIQKLNALDNLSEHLLKQEHPDFEYWGLETITLAKEMGANVVLVESIKRFNDRNTCYQETEKTLFSIMPEIDRLLKYKKSFKRDPLLAEIYCCKANALKNLNKNPKEILPYYLEAITLYSKYGISNAQKREAFAYVEKHTKGNGIVLLGN